MSSTIVILAKMQTPKILFVQNPKKIESAISVKSPKIPSVKPLIREKSQEITRVKNPSKNCTCKKHKLIHAKSPKNSRNYKC